MFGVRSELDERIGLYLQAETIPELYQRILVRWEQDYDRERPNLVRDAASIIWAARRGVKEQELLEMLRGEHELHLPQSTWSPLHLAMDASLVNRSGLITFSHDYLRQAVRSRYLATQEQRSRAHLWIIFHLTNGGTTFDIGQCEIEEIPWQAMKSQVWEMLDSFLRMTNLLKSLGRDNHEQIEEYWAELERSSTHRMVDTYRRQIENPSAEEDWEFLYCLERLLKGAGHLKEAAAIIQDLIRRFRERSDWGLLIIALTDYSQILRIFGDRSYAEELSREAQEIARTSGKTKLAPLIGQALILKQREI